MFEQLQTTKAAIIFIPEKNSVMIKFPMALVLVFTIAFNFQMAFSTLLQYNCQNADITNVMPNTQFFYI